MSETRIKALQKSPLGKIPAEIRNKVYRLVFNSAIVHVKHVRNPGILRVCHLIRTEALPILFNNALFVINVDGASGLTFDKEQLETDSFAFWRELPADTHFIKRAVSFDTFQSPYYVQPEEHIEAAHPEYTNHLSYKDDYSHLYVFELGKNP
ncbi:hypothetical protein B9Z65_6304 [Elsinoe australis]|uniref:Uncharacterized protein n=1 Tax=Elsinoe australis TaxID=40998 RepID=A0A2P8A892_9PEZI|nr:hypothetical protein B9Z65_6304 [Elsinoe australis]